MSTAGIVIVGDEVLSGRVEERNARFLSRALRDAGVEVGRITFVPDAVEDIASDVRAMAGRFDLVLTTGGVGATHDDVTLEGIAQAFGLKLTVHPTLDAGLRRHFRQRYDETMQRMALVPEGALLIGADRPAYPLVRIRNVFAFPGVPRFLEDKFELLRPLLDGRPFRLRQLFLSVSEDRVAGLLRSFAAAHPELKVGSYPKFEGEDHSVEVCLESRDGGHVDEAFEELKGQLEPDWLVRAC